MVIPFMILLVLLKLFINGSLSKFVLIKNKNEDLLFDKLQVRFKRIRDQVVRDIKDLKISDKDAKVILESLEEVDRIIAKTVIAINVYTKICNVIFTSDKNALKSAETQRLLEEIASNDLYVGAAKLKTHS